MTSTDGESPLLMSWSSGKDSAFALHTLRQQGHAVSGLITSCNASAERVAMHGVRNELLRLQAERIGLPLTLVDLPHPCTNEQYEQAMGAALEVHREGGVREVAFGDLFLPDVRVYRERQVADVGLSARFPLFGRDTRELAREMVASGLRAVLTCVDPKQCPAEFAGRDLDGELLDALPDGVDPCGENGEFHTFVHDAPGFSRPIGVRRGEVVERGGFVFADLLPQEEDS